ncbi:LHFPL tetraspan subfamily member protein [Sarotherodon galilaeus]
MTAGRNVSGGVVLLLKFRYIISNIHIIFDQWQHLHSNGCIRGNSGRPHFEIMLAYILLSFISLLTAILNLLVIISVSHFRQLHTPTNLLLLSLAVADFCVGLLLFFQIVLIDGCWFLGDIMCTLYQYLAYVITSASIGTMVIISVDRYLAICYPLHYSTKITQQRARAMRSQLAVTHQRSVTVTAKKSELKAARTLGIVVVVFLICMCPYYCVALTGQDSLPSASSLTFVLCLAYFNSCLNPIIYVFFYPWFRKSIKVIVTLQILQPDSSKATMR